MESMLGLADEQETTSQTLDAVGEVRVDAHVTSPSAGWSAVVLERRLQGEL